MTQKRVLVLNGHPAESSLSRTFAEAYARSAEQAGHNVRVRHLHDLDFDPDFGSARYTDLKPLEPVLEDVLQDIEWSQHIVLASPMWWGGLPAKLKGLLDRVLLPGRTFDPRAMKRGKPPPLLSGRTARVILTSDTPGILLRLFYRNAILWQLRGQIFELIGIKPTRFTHFTGASHPKEGRVDRWLEKVRLIGRRGA
jgi:putative NADPH-quinone reductase